MKNVSQYLIALGGNMNSDLGTPQQTLRAALQQLEGRGVEVRSVSQFYNTPCFPRGAGPEYVNAAALLSYAGDPPELLKILHQVEAHFGRERVQRWGQRTLDMDLIAAGSLVCPDAKTYAQWRDLPIGQQMENAPDQLILPHPRLQDRAFVLVPLADIAPDWCHPVLNQTIEQMLDALPQKDKSEVVPL